MEEKKSVGFAALLLSVAVAVVVIAGVRLVGGNSKAAVAKNKVSVVEEPAGAYAAGTYQASAQGAMGVVSVTVTVDENGVITGLEIDASAETESLGQAAAPKIQEAILAAGSVDGVDAISGSTITSEAIFSAVTDCLDQAGSAAQNGGGQAGGGDEAAYSAGTYEASAQGAIGAVTVTVTLDGSGVITGLEIDASAETANLGQVAAPKLQEQILEAGAIDGIDAISGCTLTCDAIFNAITDCLGQAAN